VNNSSNSSRTKDFSDTGTGIFHLQPKRVLNPVIFNHSQSSTPFGKSEDFQGSASKELLDHTLQKFSLDKESPAPLKSNRLLENANLISQLPSNHRATLIENNDLYNLKQLSSYQHD